MPDDELPLPNIPGAEIKATDAASVTKEPQRTRRDIPGNMPYLTAWGTLKRVLDRIIEAERPDRFNSDFLETVLKMTGGAARATIPILKRMGFLTSDGTPTELYARFKTEGGRAAAAMQGLRNGFAEIFRRNEYAQAADDGKLRDLIVEITGLKRNDRVATAIQNTFNAVKSYTTGYTESRAEISDLPSEEGNLGPEMMPIRNNADGAIRLAYNINIVLPETSDLKVLNAIFRSLKENLL